MKERYSKLEMIKCYGNDCPKKETCYRYLAPSSKIQAYFIPSPIKEDGSCLMYWPFITNDPKRFKK